MNLLLSKLAHWFVFGATMFFAAADVSAPAAGGDSGGASTGSSGGDSGASSGTTTTTDPESSSTTQTPSSLADIVKQSVANAEKALAKPGVTTETPATQTTEAPKPAAQTPTPEAKPTTETPAAENPLDKIGPLPAEKITAALKDAPPEVQSFLKEKGLSLDVLTENARLAAQTAQLLEVLPGGVDAAKEALEGAANYWKIDQGLAEVKDINGFNNLMNSLAELTYVRDDKGQPIPDPERPGSFKHNGAITKMLDYSALVQRNALNELADAALKSITDDDTKGKYTDLKGALDYIKQFIDNGYTFDENAVDESKLPAKVRQELEQGRKFKQEATAKESQNQSKDYDTQENSIIAETHKSIEPMIQEALKDVALEPELKATLTQLVWNRIVEGMESNDLYKRQRDTLSRQGNDYVQRRVALNSNYLKPVAARAIAELVGKIGKPVVDANQSRHQKIDAQSEAARMEPKTSGTTLQAQPGAMSADDISKKALEAARAKNPNAQMGDRDYFAEVIRLKKLPASA